ncbi:MAG: TonB-dependent receptor [Gammaproteobacteria bacterium]|nr:MAG: TonB-dependent receptor [Gammaproteobacteria bacterium]
MKRDLPRSTGVVATLLLSALPAPLLADHATPEEINVTGVQSTSKLQLEIEPADIPVVDTSALLKRVPGANVNSNGPITGIAQYRGLYGDRVSIHIDHAPTLTGGPNAMDAPLTYTPPLLLKSLKVDRGIAPVSAAQESLGGHMTAALDRGEFGSSDDFEFSGALSSRFNENSDGSSSALKSTLANQNHKFSALYSHDEGNETRIGDDDEIGGSQYRRGRYDISYGWQNESSRIEIYTGELDTRDTGTPSLPMDINYIDGDTVGTNVSTTIGEVVISGHLSYNHVDHLMDNFSQRTAPASMMDYRANNASAHNTAWSLQARWPVAKGFLTVGSDGNETVHTATISNPNNAMFEVANFNDAERDTYGVFTEWEGDIGEWHVQTGARVNRVKMDSEIVGASGMMGMMAMNANMLASAFNNGDLDEDFTYLDLALNLSRPLTDTTTLNLGLGRKNRAPSYQERYLWLPLAATGGLADGRNYIGNLDLDEETAHEVTVGLDWNNGKVWATPQVFYRRIDDYIQGVPSTNATANMLSTMMSGQAALMFDNVDAKMYGADMGYGYTLSTSLRLEGTLSYVRGKRRDEDDDLYRVAPLNNRLALIYEQQALMLALESVLYASQNKVSEFNQEEKTPGYGIVNLSGSYRLTEQLTLSGGVENLFDNRYQDHLAGYNRNADSDIAVGDRLAGPGRNIYLAATLHW